MEQKVVAGIGSVFIPFDAFLNEKKNNQRIPLNTHLLIMSLDMQSSHSSSM